MILVEMVDETEYIEEGLEEAIGIVERLISSEDTGRRSIYFRDHTNGKK